VTGGARDLVGAARRLHEALERTAEALRRADLDGLLRSEGELELALRPLGMPSGLSPADRRALRAQVGDARRALRRCRRLGEAYLDFARLSLEAQGRAPSYGRAGPAPASGRRVDTRG
jgi:hypothetical protein